MSNFTSGRSSQICDLELQQNTSSLFELIKKIFGFLSVSSLFIGGTGFFNTFIGYVLLGSPPSFLVCFEVFLITFSVYTLDKVADLDKDITNMPERLRFLKGRKNLVIAYSIAAYLLSMLLVLFDMPLALLIVLFPMAANAVYGMKLIPGFPRLKDIPIMKNVVVATSWAFVTILLPVMHLSGQTWQIATVAFYFMFIKMFINTVLFDIRDVKGDLENGVRTIPVLIGPKKTAEVLLVLNSTLLLGLFFVDGLVWYLVLALVIYGYAYILYFKERRNPLALDFCVDGEWLLAIVFLIVVLGY